MRWGVRDEATDDHQTMTICRDEVSVQNDFLRSNVCNLKYHLCPSSTSIIYVFLAKEMPRNINWTKLCISWRTKIWLLPNPINDRVH